jgi:hypothetical protein
VRPLLAGLLMLASAACSSKVSDAEQQYKIVSEHGSVADKCQKAREVQEAVLAAHDAAGFSHWKKIADRDCSDVTIDTAQLPANQVEQDAVLNAMANEAINEAEQVRKK